MMRLRSALLAATLLAAAGGAAWAQTTAAPGTYDVQQLPVTNGRVAAYSLTPRGDVDGVILDDGTQVTATEASGRVHVLDLAGVAPTASPPRAVRLFPGADDGRDPEHEQVERRRHVVGLG